jgi:hypothetical protein
MEDPERHACWLGVQTGVRRVLSWRSGFLRRAQGERTPDSHVRVPARRFGARLFAGRLAADRVGRSPEVFRIIATVPGRPLSTVARSDPAGWCRVVMAI